MKEILLTQGKVSLVDDDMFEVLNQWKWTADKSGNNFYAHRGIWVNKRVMKVKLHHCVIGKPLNGLEIDHINGSGLDNQRHNLRIVTCRQNMQNRRQIYKKSNSSYPGVCWHEQHKKWRSYIKINGKQKHLGLFINEIEAFQAYTQACREIGEPCLMTLMGQQEQILSSPF